MRAGHQPLVGENKKGEQMSTRAVTLRKWSEPCCFTACFIMTLGYAGGVFIGGNVKYLTLLAYVLFAYKILTTKYDRRSVILSVCLLAVSGFSYFGSRNDAVITNALVIIALKDVKLNKVFKLCFMATCIALAVNALTAFIGVGGPVCIRMDYGRGGIETRYTLGYDQPNQFHMTVFRAMLLFTVSYFNTMKWWKYLILFILNIAVFLLSVSRTGFLCCCFIIVLGSLYQYAKINWNHNLYKVSVMVIYWGCVVLSLIGTYCYNNTVLFQQLNKAFTGRLGIASSIMKEYTVRFTGVQYSGMAFDQGVVHLLLEWGILLFAVYQIGVFVLLYKSLKNGSKMIPLIILSYSIYGMFEYNILQKVFRNYCLVLVPILLYNEEYLE